MLGYSVSGRTMGGNWALHRGNQVVSRSQLSRRDLEPTQREPTQTRRDYSGLLGILRGLLGLVGLRVGSPSVGS